MKERRPALVISPKDYNHIGLALVAPITSGVGMGVNNFRVEITEDAKRTDTGELLRGFVVSDQIKSLDWKGRKAKRISKLKDSTVKEVISIFSTLLRD